MYVVVNANEVLPCSHMAFSSTDVKACNKEIGIIVSG